MLRPVWRTLTKSHPRLYLRSHAPFLTSARRAASPAIAPSAPLSPFAGVQLRDYQEECIRAILSSLRRGERRLGISLATGSGKTVIFTQLIDRLQPQNDGGNQTLILAHRRELVEQAARHCSNAYPSKTVEVEMGNIHASGAADITVASVQSIVSQDRFDKYSPTKFKLVLVDEAHHIVAATYLKVLEHFGLHVKGGSPAGPALVGVSATLSRLDGLSLGTAIDHIVYHKDYVDMIEDEWLSPVMFTTVQSKADISRVRKGANGDFQTGELSEAVNTDETNEITVRAWLARASERESTLVFCVDLAHLTSLTHAFQKYGIDARFITGETPSRIRSARLDAFKRREFPLLLNCGVFTEGTDIPNVDCVLLARPTKSRNLLVQMIGRGMRLYKGKENCHIIDMVASLETGIVTTPTLFGLDPGELVEFADVGKMREARDRKEREKEREGILVQSRPNTAVVPRAIDGRSITFTDYDSVQDLIDDTSGERHIRAISPFAWVQVDESRYILSFNTGAHITIKTLAPDQFQVKYTAKIPAPAAAKSKTPYARPRIIATATTFQDAVHAADTFAKGATEWYYIATAQDWRKKPASEGQLKQLNKWRDADDQLTAEQVTKGRASDMITKMIHGAKGRFGRLTAEKRKEETGRQKARQWEEFKERQLVRVGPVRAGDLDERLTL